MEKSQLWLNYNLQTGDFYTLAFLLALVILCLVWVLGRLKLSQTTTAILIFVAIRVPFATGSLWYDEAFTAWLAELPFKNMLAATAGDVHPPLWYVIEWFWVRVFGHSDLMLRLPAVLLSGLVAWQFLRLCRRIALNERVQWVAFTLLALLPFSVRYGGEARMYELLLALVMGLILLIESQPSTWNALAFGLLSAIAMLTHNLAVIYVLPFTLWFFYTRRLQAWPAIIGWALYLPWFPFALAQFREVDKAFWILPTTFGSAIGELHTLIFGTPSPVTLVLFPVALAALIHGASLDTDWETLRYLLFPVVAALSISFLASPAFIGRIMIGVLPVVVIYIAQALVVWWDWLNRFTPLGHLGKIGLVAGLVWVLVATPQRIDWATPLSTVPVKAGDTCYHMSPTSIILARRYVPQCHHIMWPHASNLEQHLTDATKAAMLIDMAFVEDIRTTTGNLWLWWGEGPNTTEAERAEVARIKRLYPPVQTAKLFDLDIVEYTAWRLDSGNNRLTQETN